MENQYSLINAIRIILKWKTPLLLFVFTGAVGSVIVSLLLPEYYKSSVIFYPVNPSLTDRQMLFSEESRSGNVEYFGSTRDVDRIITIANSTALSSYIINKFNLFEHYEIDPETKYPQTAVHKEFFDNYKILKTEEDALEVSVLDTDPQLAADMANEIVRKIDEINKAMIKKNKEEIKRMFEEKMQSKQEEVDALTDSLISLTERFNIRITNVSSEDGIIVTGNDVKGVERYKILYKLHKNALEELTLFTRLFHQYDASINDDVSSIQIVEHAVPAEKKSKPIRWLICVGTTLAFLFIGIIGVLLAEQIRILFRQLNG